MDKNISEIIDTLNVILTRMATKDEIDRVRLEMNEGFSSIREEIREVPNRLDAIDSDLRNQRGYAKEIDHLLHRVAAIEKHLGLGQKIVA